MHYFIISCAKGKWMKILNACNQIIKESTQFAILFCKSFKNLLEQQTYRDDLCFNFTQTLTDYLLTVGQAHSGDSQSRLQFCLSTMHVTFYVCVFSRKLQTSPSSRVIPVRLLQRMDEAVAPLTLNTNPLPSWLVGPRKTVSCR